MKGLFRVWFTPGGSEDGKYADSSKQVAMLARLATDTPLMAVLASLSYGMCDWPMRA